MKPADVAALAAVLAGAGAYLVLSAYSPKDEQRRRSAAVWKDMLGQRSKVWLVQAGLAEVTPGAFLAALCASGAAGAVGGYLIFDAAAPAIATALLVGGFPLASYRRRRLDRIDAARHAWPAMLEEIRMRAGSMGQSIPQALFEAGRTSPGPWRNAFALAERDWLLTTDFGATTAVLKQGLADPTADAVCETLLVAHEVGGSDVDRRLADLIEDRISDLQARKEAASKQAGVRFARKFVLVVPLGMALAGLSIGSGRAAYASAGGQLAVIVALLAVAGCWVWSGRLLRVESPPRVFK
ncbi:MAG: type II secretion system F family protein [Acidimicrobiales bacterium]